MMCCGQTVMIVATTCILLLQSFKPISSFYHLRNRINLHLERVLVKSIKAMDSITDSVIPRLHPDVNGLIEWIENDDNKGVFDAAINELSGTKGWNLVALEPVKPNTILIRIPKKLCIFSDPDVMINPLLENTNQLMNTMSESQWRSRLAVALLSERVKPRSFFSPYLRNLPFEFWGMPVFFNASEFRLLQDSAIKEQTKNRCRFFGEFTNKVLVPLQKTNKDPFSGNAADVNAFGWGFAAAASRAIRNPTVIGESGVPVMIPAIDIAAHNSNPTCKLVDDGDAFILQATCALKAGDELSIDYGPLSNDELFSDYGFTIVNNPYDKASFVCDHHMINIARAIMSQTKPVEESGDDMGILSPTLQNIMAVKSDNGQIDTGVKDQDPMSPKQSPKQSSRQQEVGAGNDLLSLHSLHKWQQTWLQAIDLYGPRADFKMTIRGRTMSQVDPRLWAFLRIIYSKSEGDLLKHGYDPYLLQDPGSMIDTDSEVHVVLTMIGVVALTLRSYETSLQQDIDALQQGSLGTVDTLDEAASSSDLDTKLETKTEVLQMLRDILRIADTEASKSLSHMDASTISPVPAVLAFPSLHAEESISRSGQATKSESPLDSVNSLKDEDAVSNGSSVEDLIQEDSSTGGAVDKGGLAGEDSARTWGGNKNSRGVIVGQGEQFSDIDLPVDPVTIEKTIDRVILGMDVEEQNTTKDIIGDFGFDGDYDDDEEDIALEQKEEREEKEKNEDEKQSAVQQSSFEAHADNNCCRSTGLSVNAREAIHYRTCKKKSLTHLLLELFSAHRKLEDSSSGGPPDGSYADEELLRFTPKQNTKQSRSAKIYELLEEAKQKTKEAPLSTARVVSEKWAGKGLDL